MDIGRSFTAGFDDQQWVTKLLLAFLFSILVVTSPAVLGFWMRYLRNVAEGNDGVLPEWNDFGTYWVRGLLVILAAIAYTIVGLLLLIVGIFPALITLQAAVVEYAMTDRPGALFAIGSVWRRITQSSDFWVALGVGFLLGAVANSITGGLTTADSSSLRALGGVLSAATSIYVSLVGNHLYGQYARRAYATGVAPQ